MFSGLIKKGEIIHVLKRMEIQAINCNYLLFMRQFHIFFAIISAHNITLHENGSENWKIVTVNEIILVLVLASVLYQKFTKL